MDSYFKTRPSESRCSSTRKNKGSPLPVIYLTHCEKLRIRIKAESKDDNHQDNIYIKNYNEIMWLIAITELNENKNNDSEVADDELKGCDD